MVDLQDNIRGQFSTNLTGVVSKHFDELLPICIAGQLNLSPRHWSSSFHIGSASGWPQNWLIVSKAKIINFPSDWLKKIKTHATMR